MPLAAISLIYQRIRSVMPSGAIRVNLRIIASTDRSPTTLENSTRCYTVNPHTTLNRHKTVKAPSMISFTRRYALWPSWATFGKNLIDLFRYPRSPSADSGKDFSAELVLR
jgi:hypothetical protein